MMPFFTSDRQKPLRRVLRWLRSVIFYEYWMIGIVDQPIRNALGWTQMPPVIWIAPFDRQRYLADPFVWPGSADTFLCESYDTKTRLGSIAAVKLADDEIAVEMKVDLPLPGHLSYPFLFMRDGVVYALPESCACGRLEILRWQEQQGVWVRHATVFENKAVADANLFEKDGLFWIAYTEVDENPHDNLHLVYAADLDGPWFLHEANPVQRGVGVSRNGGAVFEIDGRLYRPAQDCENIYGGALRIMEIVTCTPEAYEEKEVTYIAPTSRLYPTGVHTLTAWGDRCLVDGMRLVFSPRLLWFKLTRRFYFSTSA